MDSYHSDYERISKTMLDVFWRSTKEFHAIYVERSLEPPAPKRQMLVGSAVHEVLLMKQDPAECIAIYPEECYKISRKTGDVMNAMNPGPAADFRAENQHKLCLKAEEANRVLEACRAVHGHAIGELIRNESAVFEQPMVWKCETSGLACRCRPDFFLELEDRVLAWDIKTTARIHPDEFSKVCKRFHYWLQDAHYTAGLQATLGKPVEFVFWAVEVQPPYRIARFEYDLASRETFLMWYRDKMTQLARCYETNVWEDHWTQRTNILVVTPWEMPSDELDFTGADDEE